MEKIFAYNKFHIWILKNKIIIPPTENSDLCSTQGLENAREINMYACIY